MSRPIIGGVAAVPVQRHLPKPVRDIATDVAFEAIADAGLSPRDIDGLFVSPPVLSGPAGFMWSCSFAHHLGLEHMAFHGVQGRGVLVDLAHHLGHEWRGVDRATLEEIMAADGVVVEPGDVLVLHTGFATKVLEWERDPDPVKIHTMCSYLDARDPALLEWIAESQIAALVADNYAVEGLLGKDRDPGRHSFLPIHHLCLFKLGVPLGEMWYLQELAAWLRAHDRSRFLLTAPPLRMPGVVGSPVTPVATV